MKKQEVFLVIDTPCPTCDEVSRSLTRIEELLRKDGAALSRYIELCMASAQAKADKKCPLCRAKERE